MRKLLFIYLFLYINGLIAQINITEFTTDIENTYNIKKKEFVKTANKEIKRYDKNLTLDTQQVIFIPVVFATKKAAKHFGKWRLKKDSLLYYLDGKNMLFEIALQVKDTQLNAITYIINTKCKLKYEPNRPFFKPLLEAIQKEKPDIVFKAYNIPDCYWFIKNHQLYALSYTHVNRTMENFIVYSADMYIRKYLDEIDVQCIENKRIFLGRCFYGIKIPFL